VGSNFSLRGVAPTPIGEPAAVPDVMERLELSTKRYSASAETGSVRGQSHKKESPAMEYIALDLGKNKTQMCVRNASAEIVVEKALKTTEVEDELGKRNKSMVLVETCSEAFGLARRLKKMGHKVTVVPSTLSMRLGVGDRGKKNDILDARNLSESLVLMKDKIRSVHVVSEEQTKVKQMQAHRQMLVKQRTEMTNQLHGFLRTDMQRVKSKSALIETAKTAYGKKMPPHIQGAVEMLEVLNEKIDAADEYVKELAEADKICVRLMTVPGVGPVTALMFRAAIDEAKRFPNGASVSSYVGLTPGEKSSGDKQKTLGITKAGDGLLRRLLVQCALVIRTRKPKEPMAQWSNEIAKRRNKNVATVALARKLAGILFALMRDGTTYESQKGARPIEKLSEEEKMKTKNKIWPKK
jgi:transposase